MDTTVRATRAPGEQAPYRHTVLVVDDEPDVLESVCIYLEGALDATRVLTARDGTEALALLHAEPVDLILVDYRMPGMDGLELLDQAEAIAPGAARILMTGNPHLDLAIRAVNEGHVERFFCKPMDPLEVVREAQRVLHKRWMRRMREEAYRRAAGLLRDRQRGGDRIG